MAKYKVVLNNIDNLRDLLQQTYDLADMQIVQSQNEINKLANSVQLQDEIMDSKAKYAKAINDYLKIKDNAISRKLDIARILTEVCKFNGDVGKALTDGNMQQNMTFDFSKIRSIVDGKSNKTDNIEKIELGKK
jgi:hypothetical protein